ncbi:MAG: hypothetical protein IJF15_04815 [Oscillospiraceae bacterium]|nr:hypothetical protein [Oscillospiraceae bacterium]
MNGKRTFYCELAFTLGIVVLAFGVAFMERADFGMSMVVAPAYLLHLKVSQFLPFYTFGMSEYVLQAFLLLVLSIVMRKVKKSYLLSFVTAFTYGLVLDIAMPVVALLPCEGLAGRAVFYIAGMVICSFGVALLFNTYLPPEAYELFVKELSQKLDTPIAKVKTIYDCCSCLLGIVLSFAFFGFGVFVGVKWGTIVCAVVNGWMIGQISRLLERKFDFKDAFPLRERIN